MHAEKGMRLSPVAAQISQSDSIHTRPPTRAWVRNLNIHRQHSSMYTHAVHIHIYTPETLLKSKGALSVSLCAFFLRVAKFAQKKDPRENREERLQSHLSPEGGRTARREDDQHVEGQSEQQQKTREPSRTKRKRRDEREGEQRRRRGGRRRTRQAWRMTREDCLLFWSVRLILHKILAFPLTQEDLYQLSDSPPSQSIRKDSAHCRRKELKDGDKKSSK